MTNPGRDEEVQRLLGEYREELGRQAPSGDVLARLQAERRRVVESRRVIPFRPDWRMGSLALAASLVIAVGVYQIWPAPGSEPARVEMAKSVAAPPVPELRPAAEPVQEAVVLKKAETARPAPHVPPLPSMQNAMGRVAEVSADPPPVITADAAAVAPAPAAASPAAERAQPEVAGALKLVPAPALTATITEEFWTPGQTTRVMTAQLTRQADGQVFRSALTPSEAAALGQNTVTDLVAPPAQMMTPLQGFSQQAAPRQQGPEARARQSSPQIVSLGETNLEGYRCTGTRTVTGDRVVERWYAVDLGLDLLVRVLEPRGSIRVTRISGIERK